MRTEDSLRDRSDLRPPRQFRSLSSHIVQVDMSRARRSSSQIKETTALIGSVHSVGIPQSLAGQTHTTHNQGPFCTDHSTSRSRRSKVRNRCSMMDEALGGTPMRAIASSGARKPAARNVLLSVVTRRAAEVTAGMSPRRVKT